LVSLSGKSKGLGTNANNNTNESRGQVIVLITRSLLAVEKVQVCDATTAG
jgi:hypothetical protein